MTSDVVMGALVAALVAAREYLRDVAQTEPVYGYYPGGDPRDFSPDPESCTKAEIERHAEACAAWERGERPDPGGPHKPLPEGIGHVTIAHYGVGVYATRDDAAQDALDQVESAIRALEDET